MAAIQSEKFELDLNYLMQCLREVLVELKHDDLLPYIPWLDEAPASQPPAEGSSFRLVQLLSISFQLLGMIEENINVQHRRRQQDDGRLETESGLWPWALKELRAAKFSEAEILDAIRTLYVEPVFTAHPTESKRATVLEHHRDLYLQLVKRENQMWSPVERQWLKDEIKAILERLWRTGEIYQRRPDVQMEMRNMMHYLRNVVPQLLPWLDHRFESAWEQAGFASKLDYLAGNYPSFELGTWVGGDRDGHPLVTAEMTAKALEDLRLNALIILRHRLTDLAKKLSLSDQVQPPPEALKRRLASYEEQFPETYQAALLRNQGESWRVLVNIMIERLPIQVVRDHATQLDDRAYCYQSPSEVLADCTILRQGLEAIKAHRLAQNELKHAVRLLQTYGFHSAKLDIRQNSRFHDEALSQLLQDAGITSGSEYAEWQLASKKDFIHRELKVLRPFSLLHRQFSGPTGAVLSCYQVIRKHWDRYGLMAIGSFIVSMTHSAEDLFTVYLLMRESGLALIEDDTLTCPIPVVPLFETIDDLIDSPRILDEFLRHPITQKSLRRSADEQNWTKPRQQVMIGYSDSCKDGGIMASQWHLYRAQKEMAEVGHKHGVEIVFFHGRGGTVSRGAGPVHRFLQALPQGALSSCLRMTEQGETIARKYANQATGVYNIELMQASLTAETLLSQKRGEDDEFFLEIMSQLSQQSRELYQSLITQAGFMNFFRQATPIDALEHSRIGSRPPKRSGQASLEDLRAIPWVFAWNQSRFYLPSWYGVGTALTKLRCERPDAFERVRRNLPQYKLLNYVLFNVETTVASASEELMLAYAQLVEEEDIRQSFMSNILSEFTKTREILIEIFGSSIELRRPHVVKTIQLRERSLRLLHGLQIKQLRQWRSLPENSPEYETSLEALLLTINAIAGGLRNTG